MEKFTLAKWRRQGENYGRDECFRGEQVGQSSVSMGSGATLDGVAGAGSGVEAEAAEEEAFDLVTPLPCLVLRKV